MGQAGDPMPTAQRYHDIAIVSDLHLSNGYSVITGRYDPREDFFYDAAFYRFMRYLINRGYERQRPQRLILLGDVFELLQVDGRPYDRDGLPFPENQTPIDPDYQAAYSAVMQDSEVRGFLERGKAFNGLSTTPTATAWRLQRIFRGHPAFFQALAQFLAADPDNRIDLVVGNHDIEMTWERGQEELKTLIRKAALLPATHETPNLEPIGAAQLDHLCDQVFFYPWFIYEPGLFYAEHGHQYDSLNSFATQMHPVLPHAPQSSDIGERASSHAPSELIELPLGSFFVRYVFNKIESRDAFADNVRPHARYVIWALRNHPVSGLITLFYQSRLLIQSLKKTSKLTKAQHEERRKAYHEAWLRPYAAQCGLAPEALFAIDDLAERPSMTSRWQQAKQILLDPLVPFLLLLAPVVLIYRALKQITHTMRSVALLVVGIFGLIYRERHIFRPPEEPRNRLLEAARRIDAILRHEQAAARFYIFGHTHRAEIYPLRGGEVEPRYLNTGTWTPIIDPDAELLRGVTQLNFVQILRSEDGYDLAELMYWDDGAERPHRVPLVD